MKTFLGWFFGVIFGLTALSGFAQGTVILPLVMLSWSLMCLPPINRIAKQREVRHLGVIKAAIVLIGVVILQVSAFAQQDAPVSLQMPSPSIAPSPIVSEPSPQESIAPVEVAPSPLTEAEQFKAVVLRHTDGLIAIDRIQNMDADQLFAYRESLAGTITSAVNSGIPLERVKETFADQLHIQQGTDEKLSYNLSSGLIEGILAWDRGERPEGVEQ